MKKIIGKKTFITEGKECVLSFGDKEAIENLLKSNTLDYDFAKDKNCFNRNEIEKLVKELKKQKGVKKVNIECFMHFGLYLEIIVKIIYENTEILSQFNSFEKLEDYLRGWNNLLCN